VSTCRLRDYLTQSVDLLRLDIEGADVDVLLDCADLLGQVRNFLSPYQEYCNDAEESTSDGDSAG
jgi:hypothetical protein